MWNLVDGSQATVFTGYDDPLITAAISPHDAHLIAGGWRGTNRTWDVHTGELLSQTERLFTYSIYLLVFSPDGETVLAAGYNNTVRSLSVQAVYAN